MSISTAHRKFKSRTRLNRRGHIERTVAEVYVRDDIGCNSPLCQHCLQPSARLRTDALHYIFPDAAWLIEYVEILELSEWTSVVILSSVLDQFARLATPRAYNRLKQLMLDTRRAIIVFPNENFRPTCVPRVRDQDPAAFHMTQLSVAVNWYDAHMNGRIPIVLLTADSSLLSSHQSLFNPTVSVVDTAAYLYMFRGLHPSSALLPFVPSNSPAYDMIMMDESHSDAGDGVNLWELFIDLSAQSSAKTSASSAAPAEDQIVDGELYPRHLDLTSLETGIKSGVLYRGTVRVQRHRTKSAVVELLGVSAALRLQFPRGFLIADEQAMNRAFHGDEVAIEMIASPHDSRASHSASIMDVADAVGVDLPSFNSQSDSNDRPLARVRGILSRQWRPYVCMVAAEDLTGERSHVMCVPMDIRVPRIRINTRQAASLAGQRIVVSVDEWNATQRNPHGHFVSRLGPVWQADTETRAILIEHQLSAPAYSLATEEAFVPSGVKSHTLAVPFNIPASGMLGRRDLRQTHCVVSIDPPGCTDIDDALSLSQLPNGNYELGVHIADVSYFVRTGSAVDLEARARGTSVYMVDRRLDMLPRALAEGVASLHQGVDRCALSAMFEIDAHTNEIVNVWYGRTAIHNKWALTYAEAQAIVDGRYGELAPDRKAAVSLRSSLTWMLHWSRRLRSKRRAAGAVELDSFDQKKFSFAKSANGNAEPVAVGEHEHPEMCSMIEQFMVLANVYVAERIYRAFPHAALLRYHPLPRDDSLIEFERFAQSLGVKVDTSSNKALADSLANLDAQAADEEMNFRILKSITARAMSEAKYFCTGDRQPSEFYHYGLAAEFYTHFTSPIRRYADLVVHRLLLAAVDAPSLPPPFAASAPVHNERSECGSEFGERTVLNGDAITHICERLNDRNRLAKEAQRASQELFLFLFVRHSIRLQKFSSVSTDAALTLEQMDGLGLMAEAVVLELRPDGCLVFIPQYLLKCVCVFTSDSSTSVAAFADCHGDRLASDCQPTLSIAVDSTQSFNTMSLNVQFEQPRIQSATYALRPFCRVRVALCVRPTAFDYRRPPLVAHLICDIDTSPLMSAASSAAPDTLSLKQLIVQVKAAEVDADEVSDSFSVRNSSSLYDIAQSFRSMVDQSAIDDTECSFRSLSLEPLVLGESKLKYAKRVPCQRVASYLIFGGGAGLGIRSSDAPEQSAQEFHDMM